MSNPFYTDERYCGCCSAKYHFVQLLDKKEKEEAFFALTGRAPAPYSPCPECLEFAQQKLCQLQNIQKSVISKQEC